MKTYEELLALITQRGVHAVFGDYGEGFGIEQNAAELAEFLVICQTLGVESVLEIGTGYKAGLARFLRDDMGLAVTSVDVKDYGHQFGGISFLTLEHATLSGQIDLIIIDADHTYEAVKADDERWRPHATKVIAFHDIAGLRDCEGVKQYWREIAYGSNLKPGYHEIIADSDQRGGIGYIVLSEVKREPEQLLTPETIAKLKASKLFAEDKPPVKKPAPARKRTPVKPKTGAKKQ